MHVGKTVLGMFAGFFVGAIHAAVTVQATLPLGNTTAGMSIDPALAKAFVSNFDDGTVSVIDINTLSVLTTLPVGSSPRRTALDGAHHRLYIAMATAPGTILVIDTTGVAPSVSIPVGDNPFAIGSDFRFGRIYVNNHGSNTVSVIDTATNTVIATIPVGVGPGTPEASSNLKKVYVSSFADNTVTIIDELARTVIKTLPVGKGPNFNAVNSQLAKVYVNNVTDQTVSVIDAITDTVIGTLPSGRGTTANYGVHSYVYRRYYLPNATDGTLTIVNTDTDKVTKTLTVGNTPVDVNVDENGGNIYVVNRGSGTVTIIDAAKESIIGSFPVGTAPWRMADSQDHLFVLNANGTSADSLTIASEQNTILAAPIATEYYDHGSDRYRYTATEIEKRVILDGAFGDDWHLTFEYFRTWTTAGPGRFPMCHFVNTDSGKRRSTLYASVCSASHVSPPQARDVGDDRYLAIPDLATGSCGVGMVPLYRVYNHGQGGAPNHRYTSNRTTRDQMVNEGWIGEGSGADTVFACTPSLLGAAVP